jgi:purine-binding chemotaxis protein CheW
MTQPRPAQSSDVLRERARQLARPAAATVEPSGELAVLHITLGQERYALETRYVVEVHALAALSVLPCLPPFFAGLVNARGRVLPVIDLTRLLALPVQGVGDWHRVVHLSSGGIEVGVLAGLDTELGWIRPGELHRVARGGPARQAECVLGVTRGGVALLDARAILADPGLIVNEQVNA